ncbi:MAG: hypothetical protein VX646_02655 [Verrucomicrobiota bacterium]|nr:hypothetical protein [Verrucomicrobiota bacterium]
MSSDLIIVKVNKKGLLKKFVRFPYDLYEGDKYWVPPLMMEEIKSLIPEKNPSLSQSDFGCWLVLRRNKIVGRVAAFINRKDNRIRERKALRFGMIDFIDDVSVCEILLKEVEKWAYEKDLSLVEGPLGPGHFDRNCVLVDGFDELPTAISSYNYPYYGKHMESYGYAKEVDYLEHRIKISEEPDPRVEKISSYVLKKKGLSLWSARSKKQLILRGKEFFNLINEAYAGLHDFVSLSDEEIDYLIDHFFSFIETKYVKIVVDEKGDIVAAGVAMESVSKALQSSGGKLLPFGWLKMFVAMKSNDVLDLCLVAVANKFRGAGLNSILMHEMHKTALDNGLKWAETNGELETNSSVLTMWDGYDYRTHKRRRIYSKILNESAI